jgi:hypothetical protein
MLASTPEVKCVTTFLAICLHKLTNSSSNVLWHWRWGMLVVSTYNITQCQTQKSTVWKITTMKTWKHIWVCKFCSWNIALIKQPINDPARIQTSYFLNVRLTCHFGATSLYWHKRRLQIWNQFLTCSLHLIMKTSACVQDEHDVDTNCYE